MSGDVDFDFFDTMPGKSDDSKPKGLHNGGGFVKSNSDSRPIGEGNTKQSPRRGRDSSGSETESDNHTKDRRNVKKIEAKVPLSGQSRDYSDSFEDSDDQSTGRKAPSPRSKNKNRKSRSRSASTDESRSRSRSKSPSRNDDNINRGPKKQAWSSSVNGKSKKSGTDKNRRDSRSSTEAPPRPKTAAGKRNGSKDRHKSLSDSDTESGCTLSDDKSNDSDMTDVSPIHSPRNKSHISKANLRMIHAKPPKSPAVTAYNQTRPRSAKSSGSTSAFTDLIKANQDSLDLKLLMQAVMELEGEKHGHQGRPGSGKIKPQFIVPSSKANPMPRKNFSFNNDQVNTIDRENQRLMQKIVDRAMEGKKAKKKKVPTATLR